MLPPCCRAAETLPVPQVGGFIGTCRVCGRREYTRGKDTGGLAASEQGAYAMRQIVVDTNLCKKDGACVAVCPSGVLTLNEERLPEEVPGVNCILCGHCVAVCDCGALTHGGLPREDFLLASKQLPAPAIIDGFLVSRRSVREFKDRPIARETLQALLDVALVGSHRSQFAEAALDCRERCGQSSRIVRGSDELVAHFRPSPDKAGAVGGGI